jgi:predicted RND superfamily exporter protein
MAVGFLPVIGVVIAFFSAIILTLVSLFVKPKQKTIARSEGVKFLESYKDYLVPDWRARFDQRIKQI